MPLSETHDDDLMTVEEASEYLRIPKPTVYYLLQRRLLPGVQIRNRWIVRRSLLDRNVLMNAPEEVQDIVLDRKNQMKKSVILRIENKDTLEYVQKIVRATFMRILNFASASEEQMSQSGMHEILITDRLLGETDIDLKEETGGFPGSIIAIVEDGAAGLEQMKQMGQRIITLILKDHLKEEKKGIKEFLRIIDK